MILRMPGKRIMSLKRLTEIRTSIRNCGKFASNNVEDNNNKTHIAEEIRSKFSKQKEITSKQLHQSETRTRIKSPSGYQHLKRQLRTSTNVKEVMKIMSDNKKCEDVQLGTAAISKINSFYKEQKIARTLAMKHIDDIWQMMTTHVVGMNCVAYTQYFVACNILHFDSKCWDKFEHMIDNKVIPDFIALNILLKSCRYSADTNTALKYWQSVVVDMKQPVNEDSWAAFIAVCAKKRNVRLAEEFFAQCPYKLSTVVCHRMMSVYKNIGDIDKVLELKNFMRKENIKKDQRIYNTIAEAYRIVNQWQDAIDVANDAISINHWDAVTIHHLFAAYVGLIKVTDDFGKRRQILDRIETDVANYFVEKTGKNNLQTSAYWFRLLDAHIGTYSSGASFQECCSKYKIEYWEYVAALNIRTLNLFTCTYPVAKVILEHVFEKELDVFRESGLYMWINNDKHFRGDVVSKEDINSILFSMNTPMNAELQQSGLLYISSEQTKSYQGYEECDEFLFGNED